MNRVIYTAYLVILSSNVSKNRAELITKAPERFPSGPQTSSQVWKVLRSWVNPGDVASAFWWRMTGPALAILMEQAGYDIHNQYQGLMFHFQYIVNRLGPPPRVKGPPTHWKSFMTDDYLPVEYSWNWSVEGSSPKVRYSVEAIGNEAGTIQDRFNQKMTQDMINQLNKERPGINWQWFNKLSKTFHDGTTTYERNPEDFLHSDTSSTFMAFEVHGGEIATKAYFIPVKADQMGISRFSVLSEGIQSLECESIQFLAYDRLMDFVSNTDEGRRLQVIGVAINCVKPVNSRLKIYLRSPQTTLNSAYAILSMHGQL